MCQTFEFVRKGGFVSPHDKIMLDLQLTCLDLTTDGCIHASVPMNKEKAHRFSALSAGK
jgi:hypothetical protein